MANQYINRVSYGLTQALINDAPRPVQAKRAPSTADTGFLPGTLWVNLLTNNVYVLTSVIANAAQWLQISVGSGSFATISSTGAFTLDTTTAAANTLGNTTGATSISMLVGTGGFSLDGVTNSTYAIGASATTGTISIGGTGAQTGTITLAGGTGAQTVNIAASGTGAKTISLGANGSVDVIAIGSITGASSLALKSGTGGVNFTSGGLVTFDAAADTQASPSATSVLDVNVGMATFTGFTTAAAAAQVFTITNSEVLATSQILVSAANEGAADAQMTITRVKRGAGTFDVTLTNNGAAALNGDVSITFFIVR